MRWAVLMAGSLATAATAGHAVGADITDHQKALLAAFEACEKDTSQAWCAPLKPFFDHVNAPVHAPGPVASPAPSIDGFAPEDEKDIPKNLHAAKAAYDKAVTAGLPSQYATPQSKVRNLPDPSASADTASFATGHGGKAAGRQFAPPHGVNISFTGSSDTKSASIALNIDLSERFNGRPYSVTITASTPVGQGATYQNLATQDGLAKASSIDFELSRLFASWTYHSRLVGAPEYQTACHEAVRALKVRHQTLDSSDLMQPFACSDSLVRAAMADLAIGDEEQKELDALLDSLEHSTRPTIDSMWLASGHAKVGYESHSFYDLTTLAPASFDPTKTDPSEVSRTPFDVGLSFTRVFNGGDMSITGAYDYQRSYADGGKKGATSNLCPVEAVSILTCVTGYVGHPLLTDKQLATAEFRYINGHTLPFSFGVAPAFTYDLQSGIYSFAVPVYLIADETKALTGGLRYDWTSDKHESVVGIFVTSAFCILPGYAACTTPSSGSGGGK